MRGGENFKKHFMPFTYQILAISILGIFTSCTTTTPPVVDLTYSFDENTIYWPKNQSFHRRETSRGMTSKGYWYASGTFSASEHGGTHLDAPFHFAASGMTTDEIPVSQLFGPAVVIDIQPHCQNNPDYELTIADITQWEGRYGKIDANTLVLLQTGWGVYWPDKSQYLGSATPEDPSTLHFPGFSAEAISFLVNQRQIRGVGIDTASIDPGQSRDFRAHQILSKANRYALENVASLEKIPPRGAVVYALPIKIKDGTGGPVRIIALVP